MRALAMSVSKRVWNLAGTCSLLACLAITRTGGAQAAPTAAPDRPGPSSVQNSPGFEPLVDPDSASVRAGRMLNAPLVSMPLHGGARSMDELGRMVCRALHRNQTDSLQALTVREEEFREILWREFPQSRRVTGLTWQDGWTALGNRLQAGTRQAVQDFGGGWVEFVRFEVDSTTKYRNFTMHGRLTMVVRDDQGQLQRWRWLRAVVERKGRFKIYSMTD